MTTIRNSEQPAPEHFASPSDLRQFAIETATQLRQAELSEAGDTCIVFINTRLDVSILSSVSRGLE